MSYKIYYLIDPTNNEIKYVGQTCQSLKNRLNKHLIQPNRKNKEWFDELLKNKLKPIIYLVRGNLSSEEANYIEKYLIKYFSKRKKLKLHNLTKGGSGSSGFKHSEESKLKMSQIRKKSMTPENLENLKQKGIKQWENATKEQKLNNILIQKNRRIIYQYDLNNNFIQEHISLRSIERNLGYKRQNIYFNLKGETSTAYGFIWKYIKD